MCHTSYSDCILNPSVFYLFFVGWSFRLVGDSVFWKNQVKSRSHILCVVLPDIPYSIFRLFQKRRQNAPKPYLTVLCRCFGLAFGVSLTNPKKVSQRVDGVHDAGLPRLWPGWCLLKLGRAGGTWDSLNLRAPLGTKRRLQKYDTNVSYEVNSFVAYWHSWIIQWI